MAYRPAITRVLLSAAVCCAGAVALGESYPEAVGDPGAPNILQLDGSSSAYPNGTFGEQLASASQGGGGPVGSPKYRPGPGRRDDWKVGPHWRASVNGLLLFRDTADLDAIIAQVQPLPPAAMLPALEFRDNFDHAAGVRALLTSEFPQCAGYELQVGYTGLEKWRANAYWASEEAVAATATVPAVDQQRSVVYESSLHSVEVNFQQIRRGYVKPYFGVRYFGLDESVDDVNFQYQTGVFVDPPAVDGPHSLTLTQTRTAEEVENNLIGFQGGVRLDMWAPTNRFELTGFFSGGVYCNIIDRNRIEQSASTVTTKERVTDGTTETVNTTIGTSSVTNRVSGDGVRVAYHGEAALAGVYRLNRNTSLRGGYQVLFLGGVDLAENMWVSPDPVTAISDDLFLHGWFAGLEYRR